MQTGAVCFDDLVASKIEGELDAVVSAGSRYLIEYLVMTADGTGESLKERHDCSGYLVFVFDGLRSLGFYEENQMKKVLGFDDNDCSFVSSLVCWAQFEHLA